MDSAKPVSTLSFGAIAILAFVSITHAGQPTILIEQPRGGEVYLPGQTQIVKLSAKTRYKSVTIELSRDGGTTFEPLGVINNLVKVRSQRNVLAWVVKDPPAGNCVVRASAATRAGFVRTVSSGFSIGAPAVFSAGSAAVNTDGLVDGSVTTAKLADGAVTNPKLAAQAVTAGKVSSEAASSGMVLTADGNGGAAWATDPGLAPGSGNNVVNTLNDPSTTLKVNGSVLADGSISNAKLANASLSVLAGTGLSGGGAVTLGGSTTLNLADTAVAAGSYTRANIAVDGQGRLSSAQDGGPVNLQTETTGVLPVANGGTGAAAAAGARANLQAAASGVNFDITGLSGLNTQSALVLNAFGAAAGNTAEIRFAELAANGSQFVGLKAPDSIGTSSVFTLPATDGVAGQVLGTDGAGGLAFVSTPGVGTVTSVGTGDGLSGGPITSSGTVDLRLNAGGGLSKTLGAGNNELGLGTGGVTSAHIADGTIVNADVAAGAAIAGDKIAANFGAQSVVSGTAASAPGRLVLHDSDTVTTTTGTLQTVTTLTANRTYSLPDAGGIVALRDIDNTFSVAQTLPASAAQGNALITSINAGTTPIDGSRISSNFGPTTTKGDLIVHDGAGNVRLPVGADGQFLTADSTQPAGVKWGSTGGGTVTSVALSVPAEFTVSGSPVTASGTLTFSKNTQVANTVYAGPASGADAAPAFRALVAADVPSLDASKIGSGTLADARLSANVPLKNTANSFTASQTFSGNLTLAAAGNQLKIKEGANASAGVAALGVGGSVVVPNTLVTANTRIFLTPQDGITNIGTVWVSDRTPGVSFTNSSTVLSDARNVAFLLIEPAP